jgi:pyruvate kinase
MVSKFRPQCPIIATTQDEGVMRLLALTWGVYPVKTSNVGSTDEIIDKSIDAVKKINHLNVGDLVVITAGVPVGVSGTTNLIKVHAITD